MKLGDAELEHCDWTLTSSHVTHDGKQQHLPLLQTIWEVVSSLIADVDQFRMHAKEKKPPASILHRRRHCFSRANANFEMLQQ